MHQTMIARALERVGDNAVDIGEQTAFVVSGLFREFPDRPRRRHAGGLRLGHPSRPGLAVRADPAACGARCEQPVTGARA